MKQYLKTQFEETAKNHSEVRAHIEFAYEHYDDFIAFCLKRIYQKDKIKKIKKIVCGKCGKEITASVMNGYRYCLECGVYFENVKYKERELK